MNQDLTASQVADRLGVERSTVYAYASRGTLTRRPGPDGRTSVYDADEVEALARRARPRSTRRRVGAVDVVIGTTVSEIGDGWVRYRDHDLIDLVSWCTFEDACRLLWTGSLDPTDDDEVDPRARAAAVEAVHRLTAALPLDASVTSRLSAGAIASSPWVPRARTEATSVAAAVILLDALLASLPLVGAASKDPAADRSVAARLWPRLSPLPATAERMAALDTALVLLAEHELTTSTLAVRVAASTRAKPAEVVLAGLGTMSGPFHGRAAVRVHRRLAEGLGPIDTSPLAGFGHGVHASGDPRFAPLLEPVRAIADADRRAVIDRYVEPVRGADACNVDAALGALGYAADMAPGMTEAVFAIARTSGWLAHAYEEADETPLRYRGRTLYRGPR
ncbi:MAG TPA: citrate/2-methylcitrate synthase [Acidimicrobiales bacterium]|nr:citrate/2-methylcitrate synthase [Acidimicrobiales bacterium]